MAGHYDFAALKRGLVHFITGKALTALSTIAAMLLLARALPKPDFAALIVFEATINLTGIALSFGISQSVLLRYVPELRVQNNGIALYGLVLRSLLNRAWIFALACLLLALAGEWMGQWFGFAGRSWVFSIYLIGGWANLMTHPLLSTMESLLWQKTTQYIVAVTAAARVVLLAMQYFQDRLDLHHVVLIEIAYQAATLSLLLVAFWFNRRSDPQRHHGDAGWFAANRLRIWRYSWTSYGFSLSGLLTGSQPNRMVAGGFLSSRAMGDFGFADMLSNIFRRFLPSTLLQGFIRPLYFARYSETNQLSQAERIGNLILRVNLVLMAQVSLLLLMFGAPVIDALTAGKYGDTVYLVAAMLGTLVLSGLLNHYTLICQTLERNGLLIAANLIISGSLALSFPLFPAIGAWAVVVANACGLVGAMLYVHVRLARTGSVVALDFALVLRAVTAFVVPCLVGMMLQRHLGQWFGGALGWALSPLLLALWSPFRREEMGSLRRLLARQLPTPTQPAETTR